MKLQKLVDAVLELEYNVSLNIQVYQGVCWASDQGELLINTDNDVEDLQNGYGNTFAYECRCGVRSEDGYVVFYNADNGCGTRDTIIVQADMEV